MLLSCSAITPAVAASRHGHSQAHGKQVKPNKPDPAMPPPAATAALGAPRDDDLSDGILLKGLPAPWRATILDVPPPPSKAHAKGARAGTAKGARKSAPVEDAASGATGSSQVAASRNRVLIPVPSHMGIAAYQSGDNFVIVVDNAEPMNTSALHGDGIFSTLTVNTLPDATLIQVHLPDTRQLYLSQQADGWVLGNAPPPGNDYGDRRVINPRQGDGGILYPMRRPGRVLSITDSASGTRLLVGTSTTDDGGILSLRKGDGYEVWPTTEGVVVAARSPYVGMEATQDGPLLTWSGKSVPDSGSAVYATDVDLKWLGLRHLSDETLETRFHNASLAAADSDPAQRFGRRLEAARAAFNIGAFVEARGILTVALQDDPEEIARPDVRFLLGASELLCGDTEDASLLAGPWPDDQQRATQVWRGLYLASAGGHDAEAARLLARDFGRLKNYPDNVRDIVLPMAAEEIGRYGSQDDLLALDDMPADSPYQLATAFRDLRTGKRDEAYAAFKLLADDRSPVISEKALEQTIAFDLADDKMTPDAAANAFGAIIPDARLAGRESVVRLLQADAYMRESKWSNALTAIDSAKTTPTPVSGTSVAPLLFQTLAEVASAGIRGADQNSLLHDAAMLRAHLPELAQGPKKAEILIAYGKMLMALGLPAEAAQVLSDAIPMLDSPDVRALAGEALAGADIQRNQPKDATDALARTDSPDLSDDVKAARRRIQAKIALVTGDQSGALALLSKDTSPASLDTSARIHEGSGDWAAAVTDVRRIAEAEIPEKGPLTGDQQALAIRLASDASQAADRHTLDWIAGRVAGRQMEADNERVFTLLTSRAGGLPKAKDATSM
jgi:cellulose synthase operon protein C